MSTGNGPLPRFRASWGISGCRSVPAPFTGNSGGSCDFDALQVERLSASPERGRFGCFHALGVVSVSPVRRC